MADDAKCVLADYFAMTNRVVGGKPEGLRYNHYHVAGASMGGMVALKLCHETNVVLLRAEEAATAAAAAATTTSTPSLKASSLLLLCTTLGGSKASPPLFPPTDVSFFRAFDDWRNDGSLQDRNIAKAFIEKVVALTGEASSHEVDVDVDGEKSTAAAAANGSRGLSSSSDSSSSSSLRRLVERFVESRLSHGPINGGKSPILDQLSCVKRFDGRALWTDLVTETTTRESNSRRTIVVVDKKKNERNDDDSSSFRAFAFHGDRDAVIPYRNVEVLQKLHDDVILEKKNRGLTTRGGGEGEVGGSIAGNGMLTVHVGKDMGHFHFITHARETIGQINKFLDEEKRGADLM